MIIYRNRILLLLIGMLLGFSSCNDAKKQNKKDAKISKPNVIIIFTDDQGFGDLGVYGHPTIKTPNLDRMANEGQKWTNFYVSANVCTPSRAGLLTGRYAIRSGMTSNKRWVLFPDSDGGLPTNEITIAEVAKEAGYATAAVGKWHLGHLPEYLPTNHGFDSYYGIPYSNDMDRLGVVNEKDIAEYFSAFIDPKIETFNVPLMQNEKIIERPANQNTITKRYTEAAVKFILNNKDNPFFLYVAHSLPHVPLFASEKFMGTSDRGLYGDVIEEIDWSAGEIINTLKSAGIDKNTLVVFTSDNGPWAIFGNQGGSAGLLKGAKGTSYEGGMRVPGIFWWPETIMPNVVSKMGSTLDLLPTIANLLNVELPKDRIYDGYDQTEILKGSETNVRNEMIYYHNTQVFAARKGDYKLYFYRNNPNGYPEKLEKLKDIELFNLAQDPSEKRNIMEKHPNVVKEIIDLVEKHKSGLKPVKNQLETRI